MQEIVTGETMDIAILAPWFVAANLAVLPAWLLLILVPRWAPGSKLIAPVVVPAIMALGYLALLSLGNFGIFFGNAGPPGGGFSTLEALMILFTSPMAVLGGWLHYLAFDIVVGSWEVRDAQAQGIPHLLVVPCLLLTYLLGPVGYFAYLAIRAVLRRQVMAA
jgi:hypothetical protein